MPICSLFKVHLASSKAFVSLISLLVFALAKNLSFIISKLCENCLGSAKLAKPKLCL